jgi:hypothetical protein
MFSELGSLSQGSARRIVSQAGKLRMQRMQMRAKVPATGTGVLCGVCAQGLIPGMLLGLSLMMWGRRPTKAGRGSEWSNNVYMFSQWPICRD